MSAISCFYILMRIRQPHLTETYHIVGQMDQQLRGVDVAYDSLTGTAPRRLLARHFALPLYFHWLNEGWVLEKKNQIAGWLYLLHRTSLTHINDIGVKPTCRRQGLGRTLLRWANRRAYEKEHKLLTLAVTLTNLPALHLYESEQFKPIHYQLWKGASRHLPCRKSVLRLRLLEPSQREIPFNEMSKYSLIADGHLASPLLRDHKNNWYSERGVAWEVWQARKRVAYANLIGETLYLFPVEPHNQILLQEICSALHSQLPRTEALTLDLGSNVADETAKSLLQKKGWQLEVRKQILMVREVKMERNKEHNALTFDEL